MDSFFSKSYTQYFKSFVQVLNLSDNRIGGSGTEWEEEQLRYQFQHEQIKQRQPQTPKLQEQQEEQDETEEKQQISTEDFLMVPSNRNPSTSRLLSVQPSSILSSTVSSAFDSALRVNLNGVKSLVHLFCNCLSLTSLDVSCNGLTSQAIKLIVESLPKSQLRKLNISSKKATSPYTFQLSNNHLGISGAAAFCSYFAAQSPNSKRLRELIMIGVGNIGFNTFISGLTHSSAIEVLDVSSKSFISFAVVIVLFHCNIWKFLILYSCCVILLGNGLRSQQICDLCLSCAQSGGIKKLHLAYNRINQP